VAELGSFSRAARVLGVAQPALSRQVRLLETDLRETLLLRNGRGVALTDQGKRLFEHGVAILQQVVQAREDVGAGRDEPVGRVVVGLPPTIARQLTLPMIEAFGERLPRAQLAVVEGLSAHIAEWTTTGRVDLGVLYNPERAHTFRRLLETQAAHAGIRLDVAWEVSSVPTIIDLVCAGHGCAVLTTSAVAASPRAAELVVRPIVEPSIVSVLCVATSAHRRLTPLGRRVLELLRELTSRLEKSPSKRRC
jgi:LysR family nitrogen assimilation transcriptional regulator